jgi:hypothetical protein
MSDLWLILLAFPSYLNPESFSGLSWVRASPMYHFSRFPELSQFPESFSAHSRVHASRVNHFPGFSEFSQYSQSLSAIYRVSASPMNHFPGFPEFSLSSESFSILSLYARSTDPRQRSTICTLHKTLLARPNHAAWDGRDIWPHVK